MNNPIPVRVAIIDDHAIVRRGLSAILNTNDALILVGEAEDGQEAIELCELTQPEVVLMDLIMPRMDGIEATRIIHERWPQIQVLVLTSFTEKDMIQGALDAGASGYLLKNVRGRELVDAILEVHQGGKTIAQEARQTLQLSEQFSFLEQEIDAALSSVSSLRDLLNKRLPNLFPNHQVRVMIFPDQVLYAYPPQANTLLPDSAWDWLQTSRELKIFSHGDNLAWGSTQDLGTILLMAPIQVSGSTKPIGGLALLSDQSPADMEELTASVNALTHILAPALDSITVGPGEAPATRTSDELEMAGKLQSGILPENPPDLIGWDIAARLLPARETSGDFYDFIPLANEKWGILIADVTDKGLGAAVFMAMCSSLIRTYAVRFPTLPALVISSVNQRIFTDMRGGLFLTAFYGILEPQTGRLRYVNAGHNPPILLGGHKGKPIDKLSSTGMALGVSEDATWQQKMLKFTPGDLLVLYTDGITEAQNPQRALFSEHRLQETIRRYQDRSSTGMLDHILHEVFHFTQEAPDQDDMALVVVSRKR
jgi:DNA-binding NarL/FixJ family response regulator